MLEDRRLDRIMGLLDSYQGEIPLQHFLRSYFRQHREMGANDRRVTAHAIYNWFRLGKALPQLQKNTRLAIAAFLFDDFDAPFPDYLVNTFTGFKRASVNETMENKLSAIKIEYPDFSLTDIFPFSEYVSKDLNIQQFIEGFLQQPYIWLRAIKTELLTDVLANNQIPFVIKGQAIGITKPTNLLNLSGLKQEWYEVQDLSSQLTSEFYQPESGDAWYDCCAASGGKSLLLKSLMPDIALTVSDNRQRILENLTERFRRNGIKHYIMVKADLEKEFPPGLLPASFDGIIADVPCTGSGTWSRSPEQISFFNTNTIRDFTKRQQNIIEHVVPLLKPGKPLIYITCSVFKAENEEMVQWIAESFNLIIEKSALIRGTSDHADTVFAARLIKQ